MAEQLLGLQHQHEADGGDLGAALRDVLHPDDLLDRLADALRAAVPAAEGVAVAVEGADGLLRFVHTAGAVHGLGGLTVPPRSLSVQAMRRGLVLRCDDRDCDPRVARSMLQVAEMSSMLAVPLHRGDTAFGVVVLLAGDRRAFDDADAATCGELADTLAPIVTICSEATQVMDRFSAPGAPASDMVGRLVARVLSPEVATRVETRRRIGELLATGRFAMVYQPIVELPSLRLVAAEALARFPGPPAMGPDRWFADAESAGLGVELELAAVAKAVADLDRLPPSLRLAVNVGPEALVTSRLLGLLQTCDPTRIIVELTEHTAVDDYVALQAGLSLLRHRGVRMAVDDTGAGFASLTHIANLEPEFIKLDRWIVTGVDADPIRQALTGSLVGFAHTIGAKVVGEGIETAGELQTLIGLGVDYGQGYYLARPSTVADLSAPIPRSFA